MTTLRPPLRIFLAAMLVGAFSACRRDVEVASVDGRPISLEAYRWASRELATAPTPEALLDRLVRWEVAWGQADRTGMLRGPAWQEAGPRIRRAVLIRAYLESQVGRPMPTVDEVKGFYLSHGEERQVAHILSKTEAAAKAVAARVRKGEPFESLVGLSTDPSAAKNKGDLGWIKRQAVVPEFAKEVFGATVGEVRGPFQSSYGWHVALVKAIRKPTEEDFAKKRVELLAQAREMVLGPVREEVLKALRPKYPLSADDAVLALKPTKETAETEGARIAGTIGGVGISLRELDTFIESAVAAGMPDHSMGVAAKRRFLDMMGDDIRLALAAEKAGLHKKPEVRAALYIAERQAVTRAVGLAHLRQLKPDDATLQAHLSKFPDRFRGVGAVKVNLLVAKNPHEATEAAKDAEKGLPWKEIVRRHANVEATGNWDPGFLELAALKKILSPEAVKALQVNPLDSFVGPLDSPDGSMLFRILERRAGDVLPLDQCRDQVRLDYLEAKGPDLVDAFLDGEASRGLKVQRHPERIPR
jgi:hypothetical protein